MRTLMTMCLLTILIVIAVSCIQKEQQRDTVQDRPAGDEPVVPYQPDETAAAPPPEDAPEPAAVPPVPAPEPTPGPEPAFPSREIDYLEKPVLPAVSGDPAVKYPLRWVYCSFNFQVDKRIDRLIEVTKQAKEIGYNGILLTDYKFGSFKDRPKVYFTNLERYAALCREIDMEIIPCVMGTALLINNPMMAEGPPVKDQEFIVANGKATVKNTANLLSDGGFEKMKRENWFAEWDWIDEPGSTSFQDKAVKHSGESSVRLENFRAKSQHGNARINKKLTLKPWTQYKASVWIKTENLSPCGGENPKIIFLCPDGRNLVHRWLGVKPTQDWTKHTITFNTLEHAETRIYCGLWGGKSGKFWVDDMEVVESGAVNLLRRTGCPIKVTSMDGSIVYEEGKDFEPWSDPKSGHSPWAGSFDDYHEEPPVVLTAASRIKNGDTIKVSYYHALTTLWGAAFPCWLDEDLFKYGREQIENMNKYFQPRKYFMSHDEIRVAGWCQTCTATGTCGQILAKHVKRYVKEIKDINPEAEIFVWNDMFDPYHNAPEWKDESSPYYKKKNPYYLTSSPFSGAWEGLDKSVIIANWYSSAAPKNMPFFEKRGLRQIIAGYYDNANIKPNLKKWLDVADKHKGQTGVIYTTWSDNFSHMEQFYKALQELIGEH